MKSLAIQLTRAIPSRDDLDIFETIYVDPTTPEEWQLPPEQLAKKTAETWTPVEIPSGETIEVTVAISTVNNGFSMFVRQAGEIIAQLQCEGRPVVTFRTLGGESIGLQVFDREQYQATLT